MYSISKACYGDDNQSFVLTCVHQIIKVILPTVSPKKLKAADLMGSHSGILSKTYECIQGNSYYCCSDIMLTMKWRTKNQDSERHGTSKVTNSKKCRVWSVKMRECVAFFLFDITITAMLYSKGRQYWVTHSPHIPLHGPCHLYPV